MAPPIREGAKILKQHGAVPFAYHLLNYTNLWLPTWNTITSRHPIGTNIFEREWDLLIVLDACRVDALREVAKTTSWLDTVDSMQSVGSMSAEWMINTFTNQHTDLIKDTAIVSGNAWSEYILYDRYHENDDHEYEYMHPGVPQWQVVSPQNIHYHELVRPTGERDLTLHPESNRIPHIVTDRAIEVGRQQEFDRLIVHYNLPHLEHIAGALDWERGEGTITELMEGPEPIRDLRPEETSWDPGKRGQVSVNEIRSNYLQTLHFVLEYVKILLQNIDAETVAITSDHGEAFGENGVWGHPFGHPFPPVKTVPWTTTSATDERTYESKHERIREEQSEEEQREFLRQMGYL